MSTDPRDLENYQHRLGRELVAAAHRQQQPVGSARSRVPNSVILAVAATVIAVALLGLGTLRPQPAAAEVFVITQLEDEVRLDVIDIITDPTEVETQLADELGLEAELMAIPASPDLEGKIVATGSSGDGNVIIEVAFDADDAIEQIILPEGFNGDLLIEYGRRAEPDEFYEATTTAPVCGDLWASTPAEAHDQLRQLASEIRYETVDKDNNITTDVPLDRIDPSYLLIDITYLSSDQALVTYAANLDARPKHPNCG